MSDNSNMGKRLPESVQICWLGVSLDNPYFSAEAILRYYRYIAPWHKYFSVHLTDAIHPWSLLAKDRSLSQQDAVRKTTESVKRVEGSLRSLPPFVSGQHDIEVVKWSEILPVQLISELQTRALEIVKATPEIDHALHAKAALFLSKSNQPKAESLDYGFRYLLEESVISIYLTERTKYSEEISPYSDIGIISEIYEHQAYGELRRLLVAEPKRRVFHTVRFDSLTR